MEFDINLSFQRAVEGFRQFQQTPSMTTLRMLVSQIRNKNIHIDRHPLESSVNGLCIPLIDCDLVRICSDADDCLDEWTVVHELCHLYLGHVSYTPVPATYTEFLALPQDKLRIIYHRHALLHSQFNTQQEREAEMLTTELMQYFNKQEANLIGILIYDQD